MNHKTKMVLRFGVAALIVLLISGCNENCAGEQKSSDKSFENRIITRGQGEYGWSRSKTGVLYSIICIEGMKFVATPGTPLLGDKWAFISLAGPIGKCTDE